ncbi:MAG: rRNA maturation RNase YbeY [Myxococcales bacterium]|nr:rRNA maturation RNase YbeY [Myxococcales bacterium]
MRVDVATQSGAGRKVRPSELRLAAEKMLRALELPRAELSILLCRDDEIQVLNRDYRHKDKATDVLAFALREGEEGHLAGDHLGDVVISVDTAARQASERKISLKTEAITLLAHGLLHLLGWDHQTDEEELRMNKETARLVSCAIRGDRKRPSKKRGASR